MARPSAAALFFFAGVSLFPSASGRAQGVADGAAPPVNPAESACLGQSVGSVCESSTTTAAGTCQAGCCCHYVTDPEGSQVCAACLACSDTSYLDPAFSPDPCADGGAFQDAGAVSLADAGDMPVVTPGPGPTMESTGGCACSTAGSGARAGQSVAAVLAGTMVVSAMFGRNNSRRRRRNASVPHLPTATRRPRRARLLQKPLADRPSCPTTRSRTSSPSSS